MLKNTRRHCWRYANVVMIYGIASGILIGPSLARNSELHGKHFLAGNPNNMQLEVTQATDIKISLIDNLARRSAATSSRAERIALMANPITAVLPGADPSEWFSVGEDLCGRASNILSEEVGPAAMPSVAEIWSRKIAEEIGSTEEVAQEAMIVMMAAACPNVYREIRGTLLRLWGSTG